MISVAIGDGFLMGPYLHLTARHPKGTNFKSATMRKSYLFLMQHMALTLPTSGSLTAQTANFSSGIVPATGEQVQTIKAANNFQQSFEVQLKFIRAANGTVGPVVILPGAGLNGTFADLNTAGTTFSSRNWKGASSTIAGSNMQDYFKRIACYVDGVRFETDNTANYDQSIFLGERQPNGTVKGKDVNLSEFRMVTGNTYANTAKFSNGAENLVITPDLYMEMSDLAVSSYFSIYLRIVAKQKVQEMSAVMY